MSHAGEETSSRAGGNSAGIRQNLSEETGGIALAADGESALPAAGIEGGPGMPKGGQQNATRGHLGRDAARCGRLAGDVSSASAPRSKRAELQVSDEPGLSTTHGTWWAGVSPPCAPVSGPSGETGLRRRARPLGGQGPGTVLTSGGEPNGNAGPGKFLDASSRIPCFRDDGRSLGPTTSPAPASARHPFQT